MSDLKVNTFPCLRARMSDWVYYVTLMTFSDIKDWVKPVDEIHEKKEFKTWIQRDLTPERKQEIADYLLTQKQHFFSAIVVGIYRGNPDWYPVTVGESPQGDSFEINEKAKYAIGLLKLSGNEDIFAIDGQHRVEGIKHALKQNPELGMEQQCIIFVGHQTDEEGHKRTRRLFFTLNRYAKPVSRGELVALSEDDAFAIVTRRLTDEYKYLSGGFIEFTKETNVPPSNKVCITTVLSLYDLIKILAIPKTTAGSRERKQLEIGPPDESKVNSIYEQQREFWEALRQHIPEIKKVTDSKPADEVAGKYRRSDGGHVLFRPVGQKPFAKAVRTLMDRGADMNSAIKALSKTPLQLESLPWSGVIWNPTGQKVISGNETLAHNLFLYMVSQLPATGSKKYDVVNAYRKAVDDEHANLKGVPVVKFKIQ